MGPGPIYSPSERNLARSAFLTVFHHTAIAKQATRKRGTGYFFSKKEKVSTHGQNNRKSSLSPFSPLFLRVCLSSASYAAAEKSEWRMALKI